MPCNSPAASALLVTRGSLTPVVCLKYLEVSRTPAPSSTKTGRGAYSGWLLLLARLVSHSQSTHALAHSVPLISQ